MDGTWEHYAKWNKPRNERQIPYDLTYYWNLINKTNKQANYNQRYGNKEQTDSNQRGGGSDNEGKEWKGHQETCMKDPWTKPKGRGIDGKGWGKVVVVKWRQLYLNNHKKCKKNYLFSIAQ